jgi:hypothetical protein
MRPAKSGTRNAVWFTTSGADKMTPQLSEVLARLRAAIVELTSIDQQSGGAIDLSLAIEALRRAIIELEEVR